MRIYLVGITRSVKFTYTNKQKQLQMTKVTTTIATPTNGYEPSSDSDSLVPNYMFCTTWTELLSAIAEGKIDSKYFAHRELANRGLNSKGEWVGFKAASAELNAAYGDYKPF